jgi:hypothetical protein
LLVRLDWHVDAAPTVDYKVSLRLVDGGGQVQAQLDDLPIGPLLPPRTWAVGETKPGYMALPLPPIAANVYRLMVVLYDPVTLAPTPYTLDRAAGDQPLVLGEITLDDPVQVSLLLESSAR